MCSAHPLGIYFPHTACSWGTNRSLFVHILLNPPQRSLVSPWDLLVALVALVKRTTPVLSGEFLLL